MPSGDLIWMRCIHSEVFESTYSKIVHATITVTIILCVLNTIEKTTLVKNKLIKGFQTFRSNSRTSSVKIDAKN